MKAEHHIKIGFAVPTQVVSAIDGRRIINVACGGNHTLVVCEHDPRDHSRHHHRHAHQPPRSYPSPPASLQNGLTGAGPMSASNLARSASAAVGAVRSSAPHIPSNLAHSAQGPLMGGQSGVPAHVLNHSVSGLPVSGALASSTVASWLGSLSSSVSAGEEARARETSRHNCNQILRMVYIHQERC
jgi:hypothetical protein